MKQLFLLAAFCEGFLLLSVEFVYARLLHPTYGDSYIIWIAMLSVTMLGSALGYFIGSYISTQSSDWLRKFVYVDVFILICFFLSVHFANDVLLLLMARIDLIQGLVIHSLVVLLIPVALITLFNPLLVKLYSSGFEGSGTASGKVFFVSTVGGIVAVYGMAFYILPNFSLKLIIYFLALVPLLINLFILLYARKIYLLVLEMWLVASLAYLIAQSGNILSANMQTLYVENGIMGEIAVREHKSSPGNRLLLLNNATQSSVDMLTGKSLLSYPYRLATFASLKPENAKVLVAGLGGGALVNLLIDLKFDVDVIEFDQRMYDVSRKYMQMRTDFYFEVDDFRHYINKTREKYDIIILDLSKGETIPTNVYTVESFRKILSLLNPDGYILLHYPRNKTALDSFVMNSLLKSINVAGAHVATIRKHPGDKAVEEIIVASNHEAVIGSHDFRLPLKDIGNWDYVQTSVLNYDLDFRDGELLSDERNILEILQFEAIRELRDIGRSHRPTE